MEASAGDLDARVPELRGVADALGSFTLNHTGGDGARRELRALIRDYLVPRLLDPDSALVVAVVGGSGSGKSTLLNSVARRPISPAGPLRPTTTSPRVWTGEGLPPTLGGFPSLLAGRGIVSDPPPPEGLVLVDTPPPSVLGEDQRPVAAAVLEVADACLFVASGIRYADAVGWDLIDLAARRRLPTLFVLNRLPSTPEIQHLLTSDFSQRLVARGILSGPDGVIGVAEGPILPESGGLPPEWVSGARKELEALADPLSRRAALEQVVSASMSRLDAGLDGLRGALVDEAVASLALADAVAAGYRAVGAELAGALNRGELAAQAAAPVSGLTAVAARRCSQAARRVCAAWEETPSGARLLADRPEMWAHGPGAAREAAGRLEAWAEGLPGLAAAACGRPWWHRRRVRREVEALRHLAVDPSYRPETGTVRRPAALVRTGRQARERLAAALQGVLDDDADRFRALLGSPPSGALLGRLQVGGEP
jgi:energy-coupling factor transporter ATP-binding protein EcfA2